MAAVLLLLAATTATIIPSNSRDHHHHHLNADAGGGGVVVAGNSGSGNEQQQRRRRQQRHEQRWAAWKIEHRVNYATDELDAQKRSTFEANLAFIETHNLAEQKAGGRFSRLRMNRFGDLTLHEFRDRHLLPQGNWRLAKTLMPSRPQHVQSLAPPPPGWSAPAKVDWRNHSAVSNVSNQGSCGACYAFAAVGAMEGAWALHSPEKKLQSLSVQQIIDCSQRAGNMGCKAGNMVMSYNYTIVNKGIDTQMSYPYTGKAGSCAAKVSTVGAKFSSWVQVSGSSDGTAPVNISNLQYAVATMGPVAVGIDANSQFHQFYHGGFYSGNCTFTSGYKICMGDCGAKASDLNRAPVLCESCVKHTCAGCDCDVVPLDAAMQMLCSSLGMVMKRLASIRVLEEVCTIG
jgi:hypothetical protein